MNEDKIQAEFEAWAGSKKFGLSKGHFKKDEDGEYLNFPTQCYWDVWQASRAALMVEQKPANKPEVVAWRWRKPIVNNHGETVGATAWELGNAPAFLPWWTNEPLVRQSDYEALQAERDKLHYWVRRCPLIKLCNV